MTGPAIIGHLDSFSWLASSELGLGALALRGGDASVRTGDFGARLQPRTLRSLGRRPGGKFASSAQIRSFRSHRVQFGGDRLPRRKKPGQSCCSHISTVPGAGFSSEFGG